MPRAEKVCDHPRGQLDQCIHLLLVEQHVGLQEPELENLKGVDRWNVVDDVHDLRQGHLRKGSDQQVKHHYLAGDVAGPELDCRENKPSSHTANPV